MSKALYVHVPFCEHICAYCDFFRGIYLDDLAQQWLNQIIKDLSNLNVKYETIYIGGGTPTCLNLEQLKTLLQALSKLKACNGEFSIEVNVESLSETKLALMVEYGINRISMGVQSFDDNLLAMMHRKHRYQDIIEAIDLIHTFGIHNISLDLIYALPNQSMEQWQKDLEIITSLNIQHISLYSLTIEPNSYFGRNHIEKGDDELEADMYEYAIDYLEQHGFIQYEISNFAKETYESKHNQMYWNYEDFVGIGCGASGKENHVRYTNTTNFLTYFKGLNEREEICLTHQDECFEMIMMSLRLKKGLNIDAFKLKMGISIFDLYQEVIDKEIIKGRLEIVDGYLKATQQGYWLLNDILVNFMI